MVARIGAIPAPQRPPIHVPELSPRPAEAMSDGPNAVPLAHMPQLLETLVELDRVTKKHGFLENVFE